MQIKFDVDCTVEEARAVLGLPEVTPMQQALMDEIGERMCSGLEAMDPETLMKTWLPLGERDLEQTPSMFWSQFRRAAGGGRDEVER